MTESHVTPGVPDDPAIALLLRVVKGDRALAQVLGVVAAVADERGVAVLHAIASRFRETRSCSYSLNTSGEPGPMLTRPASGSARRGPC